MIHPWQIGDEVTIAGAGLDGSYRVVEIREAVPYASVEELDGIDGDVVLQTCYYGQWLMKFVALEPAA